MSSDPTFDGDDMLAGRPEPRPLQDFDGMNSPATSHYPTHVLGTLIRAVMQVEARTLAELQNEKLHADDRRTIRARLFGILAVKSVIDGLLTEQIRRVDLQNDIRDRIAFRYEISRADLIEICRMVRSGEVDEGDLLAAGGETLLTTIAAALEEFPE